MKLLDLEGNVLKRLNLGAVNVGETKEYEYKLLNDNGTDVNNISINLYNVSINGKNIHLSSDELKILKSPKFLFNKEIGIVKISWTPNLKIKKGLHAEIEITGIEIWK